MMSAMVTPRRMLAAISVVIAGALLAGSVCRAAGEPPAVNRVLAEKLPNVPGKSLTAVIVTFPPGGKSTPHHHAGSVFVYVLSGAVRSQISTGGPVVYKSGEGFFEPAGSAHLVSENVSATEPASLLAVFVADDGAQLTTADK
ncbi:MAG TPA: cupin domain-containing protein [Stellaceae bacterium]|nr:cupin domain-containing protein [Stellaceae bacterium]